MNKLWSEHIRGLTPYTPGEQAADATLTKLNTNENPYPPSPRVLSALRGATNADLRLYPDPDGTSLRRAIAKVHGLTDSHVFLGNGSDEVLAHIFLGLLKHERPILFPDITYSFYPVYCALYAIDYEQIPLGPDFAIDVDRYARPNGGIVLPNPNAPTGLALSRDELRRLLEHCPDAVVVIDEAYVDFGAQSAVPLLPEFPNLLVTQTLSKSRSLAGLRVGFAIGDPALIDALNTVKGCFNAYPLDTLALAGAEAAITDTGYFEDTCKQIIASRAWLTSELELLGFTVLASKANFIFVRHESRDAYALQSALRAEHILVRHFPDARIANYLRISIGSRDACQALVKVLRTLL